MIDLEAIRERLEAKYEKASGNYFIMRGRQAGRTSSLLAEMEVQKRAMTTDIKALVEEVERLRKIEANMPDYVLAMEETTMLRQRVMGRPRCASCQGHGSHPLGSSWVPCLGSPWVPCDACSGRGY